jgi:apolipoprotein D and lipocalin family protein
MISNTYRHSDAPIFSNATLDETRLVGIWTQVGTYGGAGCSPGAVEISGDPGALSVVYNLCLSGAQVSATGPLRRTGPGRYAAPGLPSDLWLLWVDTDVRTLVFGTPSGAFGFVLNRGGVLPGDRAQALREILDWNGYDPTDLTLWR